MSNNQTIQQQTPLWKEGRNKDIQFLSSFKRLQKEDPDTFDLIQQVEGFETEDIEYFYHVGKHVKFGLWLSRKKKNSFSVPPSPSIAVQLRPPAFRVNNQPEQQQENESKPLDKTPQNNEVLIVVSEQLLKMSRVLNEVSEVIRSLNDNSRKV